MAKHNYCAVVHVTELTHDNIDHYITTIARPLTANDFVVLHFGWEFIDSDVLHMLFPVMLEKITVCWPGAKIFVMADVWYQDQFDFGAYDSVTDVMYLNYFLMQVYQKILIEKESRVSSSWSIKSDKFLFLTGKPDKLNRIYLLNKIDQMGLLDRCEWSFFINSRTREICKTKYFQELDDQDFDAKLQIWIRSPDQHQSLDARFHVPRPFNTGFYENNLFQLISETGFDIESFPRVTEKTWLAMVNHLPFIMASSTNTLSRLQDMGFETFEKYLPIKNYDSMTDHHQRIAAIMDNVKFWLDNIRNFETDIKKDTQHNFKTFRKLAQKHFVEFENFLERHGLKEQFEHEDFFGDIHVRARWEAWYKRVKDPSWPECKLEEDFFNLPDWIQQECIQVHGYNPKTRKTS
jgi:hypothetical protein